MQKFLQSGPVEQVVTFLLVTLVVIGNAKLKLGLSSQDMLYIVLTGLGLILGESGKDAMAALAAKDLSAIQQKTEVPK